MVSSIKVKGSSEFHNMVDYLNKSMLIANPCHWIRFWVQYPAFRINFVIPQTFSPNTLLARRIYGTLLYFFFCLNDFFICLEFMYIQNHVIYLVFLCIILSFGIIFHLTTLLFFFILNL